MVVVEDPLLLGPLVGRVSVLVVEVCREGGIGLAPRALYAFQTEYREVYAGNSRQAARMAKTLAQVDARLDKLTARYGHRPVSAPISHAWRKRSAPARSYDRMGHNAAGAIARMPIGS
jgi:hypothetical protein